MAKKSNYLLYLSATCHKWTVFFNCSELLLITQNSYLNPSHILQLKSKTLTPNMQLKKLPPWPRAQCQGVLWHLERLKRLIFSLPGQSKVCRLITQVLQSDPSNYQSNQKATSTAAGKNSHHFFLLIHVLQQMVSFKSHTVRLIWKTTYWRTEKFNINYTWLMSQSFLGSWRYVNR